MKPYKALLESISSNKIEEVISFFQSKHDINWYMQGGCYEFAYSLILLFKKIKQKYQPWSMGEDLHICVESNNLFWDVLGGASKIEDKENDIYTAVEEDREWRKVNDNYVKNMLHSSGLRNSQENFKEMLFFINF